MERLMTILLLAALAACSGGNDAPPFDPFDQPIPEPGNPLIPPEPGSGGGGGGPTIPGGGGGGPTPPGTTTNQCLVPLGTNPPVGITLHIGFTENENILAMQAVFSKYVSLSTTLWKVTEGQVYIYKVVMIDDIAPGTTVNQWQNDHSIFSTTNLDVVVWPAAQWDDQFALASVWSSPTNSYGRVGRLMVAPDDATIATLTHELGHLIWQLSWAQYQSLDDEYIDGVQDAACLMESENTPLRFCSSGNHVNQSSQPHSCWTQILQDYTKFTHTGADNTTATPWVPVAEYQDTP